MSGGDTIADEDISGVKYQLVKMVDGTAGSTTRLSGDAQGQWVVAHRDLQRIAVTSGGLTIATTAYSAGDQVGTQFTLTNAARASGGTGTIVGVALHDAANIIGAYDVVFSRSSITLAADNAAYAISDADNLNVIGIAQLAGSFALTNNRLGQQFQPIPYDCSGGTSLYAGLVCRVNHTFFAAVTDLQLDVWVERN